MQLLIVEGNRQMRRLIRSILARVTNQIHECTDAQGAPEAYARWRPDYVLMDVDIVPANGIAATFKIKQSDPDAKIVILSGDNSPELRQAVSQVGAWEFVKKESLLDLIRILGPSDSR